MNSVGVQNITRDVIRGRRGKHGRDDKQQGAPQRVIQRVPQQLGATRKLPEGPGGAEVAGAVLSTRSRDGAGDDDAETAA